MNINNQNEYKKPLGTRLFIMITVCMFVVAMAVPAFAVSPGTFLFSGNVYGKTWTLNLDSSGHLVISFGNNTLVGTDDVSDIENYFVEVRNWGTSCRVAFCPVYFRTPRDHVYANGDNFIACTNSEGMLGVGVYSFTIHDDGTLEYWNKSTGSATYGSSGYNMSYRNVVAGNVYIYDSNGGILFIPTISMPDMVTGVLPTVLNWIQQTLNALFVEGGALQGLLLLVAVPVAITLLLLGARFIRSVIWGA